MNFIGGGEGEKEENGTSALNLRTILWGITLMWLGKEQLICLSSQAH